MLKVGCRENEYSHKISVVFFVVVENILEHGNHRFRDVDLFVSRAPLEENNDNEEEEENPRDEEYLEEPEKVDTNAILVEGLNPSTEKEVLELFFENTKRSGGGEIKDIRMYQTSGKAIIWFAENTSKRYYVIFCHPSEFFNTTKLHLSTLVSSKYILANCCLE